MKKTSFFFTALLLILNLCLSNGFAQDYTQWRLPDGAKARIGKGRIKDIKFSPDNTQLAVATTIGVWLYDAQTGAEIALLKERRLGHRTANTLAFSPDSKTLSVEVMMGQYFSGIRKTSGTKIDNADPFGKQL